MLSFAPPLPATAGSSNDEVLASAARRIGDRHTLVAASTPSLQLRLLTDGAPPSELLNADVGAISSIAIAPLAGGDCVAVATASDDGVVTLWKASATALCAPALATAAPQFTRVPIAATARGDRTSFAHATALAATDTPSPIAACGFSDGHCVVHFPNAAVRIPTPQPQPRHGSPAVRTPQSAHRVLPDEEDDAAPATPAAAAPSLAGRVWSAVVSRLMATPAFVPAAVEPLDDVDISDGYGAGAGSTGRRSRGAEDDEDAADGREALGEGCSVVSLSLQAVHPSPTSPSPVAVTPLLIVAALYADGGVRVYSVATAGGGGQPIKVWESNLRHLRSEVAGPDSAHGVVADDAEGDDEGASSSGAIVAGKVVLLQADDVGDDESRSGEATGQISVLVSAAWTPSVTAAFAVRLRLQVGGAAAAAACTASPALPLLPASLPGALLPTGDGPAHSSFALVDAAPVGDSATAFVTLWSPLSPSASPFVLAHDALTGAPIATAMMGGAAPTPVITPRLLASLTPLELLHPEASDLFVWTAAHGHVRAPSALRHPAVVGLLSGGVSSEDITGGGGHDDEAEMSMAGGGAGGASDASLSPTRKRGRDDGSAQARHVGAPLDAAASAAGELDVVSSLSGSHGSVAAAFARLHLPVLCEQWARDCGEGAGEGAAASLLRVWLSALAALPAAARNEVVRLEGAPTASLVRPANAAGAEGRHLHLGSGGGDVASDAHRVFDVLSVVIAAPAAAWRDELAAAPANSGSTAASRSLPPRRLLLLVLDAVAASAEWLHEIGVGQARARTARRAGGLFAPSGSALPPGVEWDSVLQGHRSAWRLVFGCVEAARWTSVRRPLVLVVTPTPSATIGFSAAVVTEGGAVSSPLQFSPTQTPTAAAGAVLLAAGGAVVHSVRCTTPQQQQQQPTATARLHSDVSAGIAAARGTADAAAGGVQGKDDAVAALLGAALGWPRVPSSPTGARVPPPIYGYSFPQASADGGGAAASPSMRSAASPLRGAVWTSPALLSVLMRSLHAAPPVDGSAASAAASWLGDALFSLLPLQAQQLCALAAVTGEGSPAAGALLAQVRSVVAEAQGGVAEAEEGGKVGDSAAAADAPLLTRVLPLIARAYLPLVAAALDAAADCGEEDGGPPTRMITLASMAAAGLISHRGVVDATAAGVSEYEAMAAPLVCLLEQPASSLALLAQQGAGTGGAALLLRDLGDLAGPFVAVTLASVSAVMAALQQRSGGGSSASSLLGQSFASCLEQDADEEITEFGFGGGSRALRLCLAASILSAQATGGSGGGGQTVWPAVTPSSAAGLGSEALLVKLASSTRVSGALAWLRRAPVFPLGGRATATLSTLLCGGGEAAAAERVAAAAADEPALQRWWTAAVAAEASPGAPWQQEQRAATERAAGRALVSRASLDAVSAAAARLDDLLPLLDPVCTALVAARQWGTAGRWAALMLSSLPAGQAGGSAQELHAYWHVRGVCHAVEAAAQPSTGATAGSGTTSCSGDVSVMMEEEGGVLLAAATAASSPTSLTLIDEVCSVALAAADMPMRAAGVVAGALCASSPPLACVAWPPPAVVLAVAHVSARRGVVAPATAVVSAAHAACALACFRVAAFLISGDAVSTGVLYRLGVGAVLEQAGFPPACALPFLLEAAEMQHRRRGDAAATALEAALWTRVFSIATSGAHPHTASSLPSYFNAVTPSLPNVAVAERAALRHPDASAREGNIAGLADVLVGQRAFRTLAALPAGDPLARSALLCLQRRAETMSATPLSAAGVRALGLEGLWCASPPSPAAAAGGSRWGAGGDDAPCAVEFALALHGRLTAAGRHRDAALSSLTLASSLFSAAAELARGADNRSTDAPRCIFSPAAVEVLLGRRQGAASPPPAAKLAALLRGVRTVLLDAQTALALLPPHLQSVTLRGGAARDSVDVQSGCDIALALELVRLPLEALAHAEAGGLNAWHRLTQQGVPLPPTRRSVSAAVDGRASLSPNRGDSAGWRGSGPGAGGRGLCSLLGLPLQPTTPVSSSGAPQQPRQQQEQQQQVYGGGHGQLSTAAPILPGVDCGLMLDTLLERAEEDARGEGSSSSSSSSLRLYSSAWGLAALCRVSERAAVSPRGASSTPSFSSLGAAGSAAAAAGVRVVASLARTAARQQLDTATPTPHHPSFPESPPAVRSFALLRGLLQATAAAAAAAAPAQESDDAPALLPPTSSGADSRLAVSLLVGAAVNGVLAAAPSMSLPPWLQQLAVTTSADDVTGGKGAACGAAALMRSYLAVGRCLDAGEVALTLLPPVPGSKDRRGAPPGGASDDLFSHARRGIVLPYAEFDALFATLDEAAVAEGRDGRAVQAAAAAALRATLWERCVHHFGTRVPSVDALVAVEASSAAWGASGGGGRGCET